MREILITRGAGHGDVLCLTSLIPGIKYAYPDSEIDLCANPGYTQLVVHDPRIRRVFEERRPAVNGYDIVFKPNHGRKWTKPIPVQQCEIAGVPFSPPQYFPTQDEMASAAEVDVAVCATATDLRRMCSTLPIALETLKEDLNVAQVDNGPNVGIPQPKTSIREAAAIIAKAKLTITVDTSLMHVAVALGVPTIILFGPLTGPRNQYIGGASYLTTPSEGEIVCLARQLLSQ